ncbi:MAG: hypothetical protein ACKVON_04940 [Beijerinckiaceae bacterium]
MLKFAVLSVLMLTLAGCQTIEERRAEIDREDDARCAEFGARRGTPGYTQCRIELDRTRSIDSANRQPVVITRTVVGGPIYRRGPGFCRPTPFGLQCF